MEIHGAEEIKILFKLLRTELFQPSEDIKGKALNREVRGRSLIYGEVLIWETSWNKYLIMQSLFHHAGLERRRGCLNPERQHGAVKSLCSFPDKANFNEVRGGGSTREFRLLDIALLPGSV